MMLKHIYLAGGCFWGTEHFFKQIDGVVETDLDKHPDGYCHLPKALFDFARKAKQL